MLIRSLGRSYQLRSTGTPEFRLVLSSGRTIEFAKIFGEIGKAFERSLKDRLTQSKPRLLRFSYDGSSQPSLLISRRGKELHGPLASFYEDGSPLAYASYRNGERTSTLFTWDETKHPLVFEQYRSGQRHGLRCLFKSCGDNCDTGHIWLVQEWDQGELKMAHVVLQDGSPVTVSYQYDQPDQTDDETMDELAAATAELDRFEKRLDTDEEKVRIATAEYHMQLQRVVSAQARARLMAAQHRLPSFQIPNLSMTAPSLRIRTPSVSMGRNIGCAPVRSTGSS